MLDLNKEIKAAMLAKDHVRLSSLRAIKSALILAQTEKGAGEVDDLIIQKIIQKQVKQRKDAADIYISQSRQDLADEELAQVRVLEEFLPEQMSEDQILVEVSKIINELGASSMGEMGKVMGVASKKLAGKADGKIIAQIVKSVLLK
ncbi:MAG: GatB/YqeY domain-containing protein [Flavobacteriales bacterium]